MRYLGTDLAREREEAGMRHCTWLCEESINYFILGLVVSTSERSCQGVGDRAESSLCEIRHHGTRILALANDIIGSQ